MVHFLELGKEGKPKRARAIYGEAREKLERRAERGPYMRYVISNVVNIF